MTSGATAPLDWAVVVPVKRLPQAKTRLLVPDAPTSQAREELALAMALDTIAAALGCASVRIVVAVTDDPVAAPQITALGATVVPDAPDAGLNPALAHGADQAHRLAPDAGVAALSSDLPALRPADLAAALALASSYDAAVVADVSGTGTTLLTAGPRRPLPVAFGAGSLERHVAAGAVALDASGLSRVRRDVDTWEDLTEAAALGLGERTATVLAGLRSRAPNRLR